MTLSLASNVCNIEYIILFFAQGGKRFGPIGHQRAPAPKVSKGPRKVTNDLKTLCCIFFSVFRMSFLVFLAEFRALPGYVFLVGRVRAKENPAFCTTLGIVVFIRWMQFLLSLCQYRGVGLHILPITETMRDIGPFCAVIRAPDCAK